MTHERNAPYDSTPGTEAIRRIKIPELGDITLGDVDDQIDRLNDLRGVVKVEAARHASDKRILEAAELVRRIQGTVTPAQQGLVGYDATPEAAADYTQGMPIVYANDAVRSAYEATRGVQQSENIATPSGTVVHTTGGRMRVMPDGVVYPMQPEIAATPLVQYLPGNDQVIPAPDETVRTKAMRERLRSPRARLGLGVAAVALVAGTGFVSTQMSAPVKSTVTEQGSGNSTVTESAILPLASVAGKLAESFDGCLNEQGQGTPILRAKQTAIIPESWAYVAPDKSKVVLSATLNGQEVKPVVKLAPPSAGDKTQPDWNIGIAACVTKDNLANVVTVDEKTRTVAIDYKKISPQLQEGASSYLVGFLRNETDMTAVKGEDVIKALLDKKFIDQAEATRLTAAYTDKANNVAESAQAVRRASEAIVKSGDIYEKQISASLQTKIESLVKAQLDTLQKQGVISKDDVTVTMTGDMNPLAVVGPAPAKADAFTTDQAKIVQFEIATEASN